MRIQTRDIPQADRIESVVAAVLAISNGARTDIEIANNVPGIVGDARQGRYYRKAAQILGFVVNERNNASLTAKGKLFVKKPGLNNPFLISSVLNLNLYQKLLPYLELHKNGRTRSQIMNYLISISALEMGGTMLPRRISTILAWIKSLGIVKTIEDRYILSKDLPNSIPIIELNDIEQPIIPSTGDLKEYEMVEQRINDAEKVVMIYKDQARLDRANNSHKHLVNLVAERIKIAGGIPKSNQFIDLATILDHDYIFEMKSTNERNLRDQIRKGISQLYEYRYLQNKPDAKLILVLESQLTSFNTWMVEYLENDREIHLVWDGNNSLYGTEGTRKNLKFLKLLS